MNIDLSDKKIRKAIAKQLHEDIDLYCEESYNDGPRNHLGASVIAHNCSRYLWYLFRWCFEDKPSGRMQRLFDRGYKKEERFITWLEGIGCKVSAFDFENYTLWFNINEEYYDYMSNDIPIDGDSWIDVSTDKTHQKAAILSGIKFKQHRVSDVDGHFGGSLDAIIQLPEKFNIPDKLACSFKTHKTGSHWNKLKINGMISEKYEHLAQESVYCFKKGLKYFAYLSINKNDDDLHIQIEPADLNLGQQMEYKAEKIIYSKTPPPKLSENPTFMKCSYCAAKQICHFNAPVFKNCRSCSYSDPVKNAEWYCSLHNSIIPKEFIIKGCDKHNPVTDV